MTRSFDLDARTALDALERCVERLKLDDTNEDLARDCAMKAWHLCDHVATVLAADRGFEKTRVKIQEEARASCPELAWMQDICTESKHGKITKYDPTIEMAHLLPGDYDPRDYDPRDFYTGCLEVVLPGAEKVPFKDVADAAVGYWQSLFRKHGLA